MLPGLGALPFWAISLLVGLLIRWKCFLFGCDSVAMLVVCSLVDLKIGCWLLVLFGVCLLFVGITRFVWACYLVEWVVRLSVYLLLCVWRLSASIGVVIFLF